MMFYLGHVGADVDQRQKLFGEIAPGHTNAGFFCSFGNDCFDGRLW